MVGRTSTTSYEDVFITEDGHGMVAESNYILWCSHCNATFQIHYIHTKGEPPWPRSFSHWTGNPSS
jgi:hypothetical protein